LHNSDPFPSSSGMARKKGEKKAKENFRPATSKRRKKSCYERSRKEEKEGGCGLAN